MNRLVKRAALRGICVGLAAGAIQFSASASLTATLNDTYTGGIDPYAFVRSTNWSDGTSTMDSVGGGVFNIGSANVLLNGSMLTITINTAYAGVGGTSAADHTNYGDLLLGNKWTPISGANASTLATDWNSVLPSGYQVDPSNTYLNDTVPYDNAANGYLGDVYSAADQKAKEWGYAVDMVDSSGKPYITSSPTVNSSGIATGQVALYAVLNATTTLDSKGGGMVLSSANCGAGDTTHGLDKNCGYYYRAGEAVQYIPDSNQTALALGTYTINANTHTVTYSFSEASTTLGDNFAISWAMTCANDIIQGQVRLPEPGSWAMLMIGLGGLAGLRWRTRRAR